MRTEKVKRGGQHLMGDIEGKFLTKKFEIPEEKM